MNPSLNTIAKNNATTNILLQGIPTFGLKLLTLLGVPLIDILHHRIWPTNRRQPNHFRVLTINGLNDFVNPLISAKITVIEQGTAFSRRGVFCQFHHSTGKEAVW